MLLQVLRVQQFSSQDRFLLVFVRIKRCDALLGGTVFLIRQSCLLQAVQFPVPGQQKRGPVADLQVLRCDRNTLAGHILDLLPEVLRVQRNAVTQDVHHARPENAGGQQMQGKFAVIIDNRVAGVAAALIADHNVIAFCQQVHHAALAFIAPVDSYNCTSWHIYSSEFSACIFCSKRFF